MRTTRKALAGITASLAIAGMALLVPALTSPAAAASLTEVTSFGSNPGGMKMHVYLPNNRPANPGIVVAMHGCGGNGPGFYSGSEFATLADKYGFIVIYPSAVQQAGFGTCFDTWSDAAKKRDGGSDPVSIVSMINYVEKQYGGDPARVFATGSSSGGMMTQEMMALYPDVFKAGAGFMGVPFGCFANAADYAPGNSKCTGSQAVTHTAAEWGDMVRKAYPNYSGPRPKLQLWHGTADNLVPYSRLAESVKQWTNVLGLSTNPTSTDSIQSGWNRQSWADSNGEVKLEAISVQGAGHALPQAGQALYAIRFFGLDNPSSPSASASSPKPSSASPSSVKPSSASPSSAKPSSAQPSSVQPSSPSSSAVVTGACRVTTTTSAWSNGLTANLTIANTGSAAVNGWSLTFTLPSGQSITSGWSATYSPSSGQVTAKNAGYNGSIAPGGSISIGYQASHSGNPAAPTGFALNGAACSAS